MRVPVFEVKYFQSENPCGYVTHEPTDNPFKTFMISVGPFLVNTILGAFIVTPAAIELFKFGDYSNILNLLLGWLGISILMHAFPSRGDAGVMVSNILKNKDVSIFAKILVAPVIGLIYLGAIGSVIWLDLIYAAAVANVIPNLLLLF
jgi:hypothetical protein